MNELYAKKSQLQSKLSAAQKLSSYLGIEKSVYASIPNDYSVDDVFISKNKIENRNLSVSKNKNYIDNNLIPRLQHLITDINQSIYDAECVEDNSSLV